MDEHTTIPLIGAAILVVVASLPAARGAEVRAGIALYAAALVGAVVAVRLATQQLRYVPDTLPMALARHGAALLSNATERNVLVFDGGSYPCRGIDDGLLARELRGLGYSVRVIHLGMSAGNHFERYQMSEDLLRNVPAKRKPASRVVYLAEVQTGYDQRPLAQLAENRDTARAYHYLTPPNAAYGLFAVFRGGGKEIALEHPVWTVARHAMVNAFHAGAASRLVPWSSVKSHSGFIPGGIEQGYRFPGLDPVLSAATAPVHDVEIPRWLFTIREPLEQKLWGPHVDAWVYYGVPSTTEAQMKHVRRFCELTSLPCLPPADPDLVKSLDTAPMWRNSGHLTTRGAREYTRWLAKKLDAGAFLSK